MKFLIYTLFFCYLCQTLPAGEYEDALAEVFLYPYCEHPLNTPLYELPEQLWDYKTLQPEKIIKQFADGIQDPKQLKKRVKQLISSLESPKISANDAIVAYEIIQQIAKFSDQERLKALGIALKKDPTFLPALFRYTKELKDHQESIRVLKKTLNVHPDNAMIYYTISVYAILEKDFKQARLYLQEGNKHRIQASILQFPENVPYTPCMKRFDNLPGFIPKQVLEDRVNVFGELGFFHRLIVDMIAAIDLLMKQEKKQVAQEIILELQDLVDNCYRTNNFIHVDSITARAYQVILIDTATKYDLELPFMEAKQAWVKNFNQGMKN